MSDLYEVSHREIFDRLVAVERKVDSIERNTVQVVAAFNAAQGAFAALEFIGKVAKPLIWIGGLCGALALAWQNYKAH